MIPPLSLNFRDSPQTGGVRPQQHPVIQRARPKASIEIQRVFIPIQGRPLETATVAFDANAGHRFDQGATDSLPANSGRT